jgi:hypothetical protein
VQTGDTLNGSMTQSFASKDVLGTGNSTLIANGTYTMSDGHGGNNYTVTVLTAPGTITPASLTIKANDVSKVYGQVPTLTGFTTSALENGETVGSVTQTSTGQAASAAVTGSPYAIVGGNASGGTFVPSNYSITYVNGMLAVVAAAVVPPVVPEVVPPVVDAPDVGSETVSPMPEPTSADPASPLAATDGDSDVASGISESQAMPKVPLKDPRAALLVIAQHPRPPAGLLVLPAKVMPARVLPVRPPKQDRN